MPTQAYNMSLSICANIGPITGNGLIRFILVLKDVKLLKLAARASWWTITVTTNSSGLRRLWHLNCQNCEQYLTFWGGWSTDRAASLPLHAYTHTHTVLFARSTGTQTDAGIKWKFSVLRFTAGQAGNLCKAGLKFLVAVAENHCAWDKNCVL
jgi:hypothetical protein